MNDPFNIQTRPIVTWPGKMTPANERKPDRYVMRPLTTRSRLRTEMDLLGATDVFIQGAYLPHQIRIDGMPKTSASPSHPGIILTYNIGKDTYQLPCDTFKKAEQNLRAIVLTLQRLRLIEETGVKTHGRQYAGFKQLEAFEDPASVLAEFSDFNQFDIANVPQVHRLAYREACRQTHPDNGGKIEDFKRVQRAAELLGIRNQIGARQ